MGNGEWGRRERGTGEQGKSREKRAERREQREESREKSREIFFYVRDLAISN
jgi:hypothetical protein